MSDDQGRRDVTGQPVFDKRDINWRLIGFIVAAVLGVIFFIQNDQTAELNFLFFSTESKTRWLVITCIALGVVADRLFSMWWARRKEPKANEKRS
jgi:uncharacterized integral membrane protein